MTVHVKFHQICTWQAPFVESIQNFSWKIINELCLAAMKSDAKSLKTLICSFLNDKNFEFWPGHSKFAKFPIWLVPLVQRIQHVWHKKVQRSYLSWHWAVMTEFHQSTWKSQNWNFDGIFLTKVDNIWA